MEVIINEWPIVTINVNTKIINNKIYDNFKIKMLELLKLCAEKTQQCVLIVDISKVKSVPINYAFKINNFSGFYLFLTFLTLSF